MWVAPAAPLPAAVPRSRRWDIVIVGVQAHAPARLPTAAAQLAEALYDLLTVHLQAPMAACLQKSVARLLTGGLTQPYRSRGDRLAIEGPAAAPSPDDGAAVPPGIDYRKHGLSKIRRICSPTVGAMSWVLSTQEGNRRLSALSSFQAQAPPRPSWFSSATTRWRRLGRQATTAVALAAAMLMVPAVAVRGARRACEATLGSALLGGHAGLAAFGATESPPAPPLLSRSVAVIRTLQLGAPAAPAGDSDLPKLIRTWLSHLGIQRAEQRCRTHNQGVTWSSLRYHQQRRGATAQGSLAGREPPAHGHDYAARGPLTAQPAFA